MPTESRTIYYLENREGFAEPISEHTVVPMTSTIVMYKGVYISEFQITSDGLEKAKLWLRQQQARMLLRPVPTSDGPPNWAALVYRQAGNVTVRVRGESTVRSHYTEKLEQAVCYHADPPGNYAWETDVDSGKAGYFLTGAAGSNALWRVTRIQADALNRQVLTFAPVMLTPTLAIPLFENVDSELRPFLHQHFLGFQQAIVRNAPFDAIDRANNLTEGILRYCLSTIGATPSSSLDGMLDKAKGILADKQKQKDFLLTYYAYNLAQVIRQLHARLHHNQAVDQGKTVRPEVGLNLSVTVSELLVEVGLGKY